MRRSGDIEKTSSFTRGVLQRVASYAWDVLDAYFPEVAWWVEWESDEDLY